MSSSKPSLKNIQVITAGSMTGTSTLTGTTIDCIGMSWCGIHLSWSGTPNGTFVVQIPATFNADKSPATWATLPVANTSGASLTAAGSAGSHQIAISDIPFSHIRVSYTNSSSTGTLDAWMTLKGI